MYIIVVAAVVLAFIAGGFAAFTYFGCKFCGCSPYKFWFGKTY